jgi:DnaJ-class molecular chaperone
VNHLEAAAGILGVTLPVKREDLKKAYRQRAKELHTDTSGTDSKEDFILMRKAYECLCEADVFSDGPKREFTEEGTPLSDLGLGLKNKNGKQCVTCKGVGYRTVQQWRIFPRVPGTRPCSFCTFLGSSLGCSRCDGKFNRRLVSIHLICAPCQGSGETEMFNPVLPKGLFGR